MRLAQFHHQKIEPIPIVLQIKIVALEVSELEQLQQRREVLFGNHRDARIGDRQGHLLQQVAVPTRRIEAVLEALRDADEDGLEAGVVVLYQARDDERGHAGPAQLSYLLGQRRSVVA